jgi:hypothetical protein
MHVVPKRLGPWSLKAEVVLLSIIVPVMTQVSCSMLRMCALVPPAGLTTRCGLGVSARMALLKSGQNLCWQGCSPYPGELRSSPLSTSFGAAQA